MGRTLIISFFLITMSARLWATHLVGGEFEMLHIDDNLYLFRQIQYFDVVHGNPDAEDNIVNASIFRKRDNLFVKSLQLRIIKRALVEYSNPVCSDDRLVTRRLEYETVEELDPALFGDPEGYYLVWERCCRNNIITNIVNPDETGQTFYLEFPPIVRRGAPFINSSPQLFPPLSDYGCVGRDYYADFRGADADGDSLSYSLVTPLNVHEPGEPVPTPQPLPIPPVQWVDGISEDYQVPGSPTLGISPDGILRVTPSEEGLFVFSVRCEEFRDGVKIGEVRRDFQLYVIDCVLPGAKPNLVVQAPGDEVYSESLDMLEFTFEESKCLSFGVTDMDGGETLQIMAEAVNFDLDVEALIPDNSVSVSNGDDTVQFEVCLPDCSYTPGEPYILDVMALDGTCPQPQRDTVRLVVSSALPPNSPPVIMVPAEDRLRLTFSEGDSMELGFSVVDADSDSLEFYLEGVGFDASEYGIAIDTIRYETGEAQFTLRWDFDCRRYDFSEQRNFELVVYAEDKDQCALDNPDSVVLNVEVQLPANQPPVIAINGSLQPGVFDAYIEQKETLEVLVTDPNVGDSLTLRAEGVGFVLSETGMALSPVSGTSPISAPFAWQIGCTDIDLNTMDTLRVQFIAEDSDYCKIPSADTLEATIRVLPPKNTPPLIYIDGVDEDSITVYTNREVDLSIRGSDADNDQLVLRLIRGGDFLASLGTSIDSVAGTGAVQVPFQWTATCDMLSPGYGPAVYEFAYVLDDKQCINPLSDTLAFKVTVADLPVDHDFLLPNVFTPNAADDINTHYYVPDLPVDNCKTRFEKVVIINRWGREVFSSTDRDFEWNGLDISNGVYYYQLEFTDRIYKGTVSVIR